MRIAIVHYHLRPGGVTRVIEHAARLLSQGGHRVVVLASGEVPGGFPAAVSPVAELAYDEGSTPTDPEQLQTALLEAVRRDLGGLPDLWHVHNHHLGKNLALPHVVAELARQGQRLLLQIHDFPEDFRPYNYRRIRAHLPAETFDLCLYPDAPQVHYAVLNGRDRGFLEAAGLPNQRLHWLPNPVWLPAALEAPPEWPGRLWLYPTRAIRRKNLGEFLLWAALAESGDHFATSLAPENPREQAIYRRWVTLAEELKLPVTFDLAGKTGRSFTAMVQAAHCLVTTSVAEGFGMAFLEPWMLGRPVTGRDLPEITVDFQRSGLDLRSFYTRLEVPVAWLGERTLRRRLRDALTRLYDDYRLPPPEEAAYQQAWRAWVREGRVDFGRLDEPLQARVIRHLRSHPEARRELDRQLQIPADPAVAGNREVVGECFNPQQYGHALLHCYERVLASGTAPPGALDGHRLLRAFLQPQRLALLRL